MKLLYQIFFCIVPFFSKAQNVGIGTTTPAGKLHIKGSADVSQLTIDAGATQSNTHPLIRLRSSAGIDLLHINADNPENVFIGINAGRVNSGVNYNTFVGSNSGYSNTSGSLNTGVGRSTLYSNTTGYGNTANGYNALYFNNTGINNTATGYIALYSNEQGNENAAYGSLSLVSNTTGNKNTAVGYQSLTSNSIGSSNTAIGDRAAASNSIGIENVALGAQALYSNTSGNNNTGVGSQAFYSNTSGINCTALGSLALYNNTAGSLNTATGFQALLYNVSGNFNTAHGVNGLLRNKSGDYNTSIGYGSLIYNETGSNNIAIGAYSGSAYGSPNIQNTISIGNEGILNGASNQAFIGNLSTGWIGGNKTWSTFSDARIKTNIQENVKGLDFIMKLRPVTYFKSMDAITQLTGNKETANYASKHDVDKILQSGFLAQEVEQAAKAVGYDFSGLHVPADSKQLYSLSYSEFVVPLVKAIQEQQKMIEDLKRLLTTQQTEIDILKQKVK